MGKLLLFLLLSQSVNAGPALIGDVLRLSPTTLPATCANGDVRVDTTNDELKMCRSNAWVEYVETAAAQSLTNKTIGDELIFDEIAEPSAPATGKLALFTADDAGFSVLEWKDEDSNVFRIGEDIFRIARNTTGSTITKGQLVGYNGSTGQRPNVALALASNINLMPAVAMAATDVANNAFGIFTVVGRIEGIDTSAFSEGDALYVSSSTAGGLTATEPLHPNILQSIGTVENSHATQGAILINIAPFKGNQESGTIRDLFKIGDDTTDADKVLAFAIGNGSTDPKIQYDTATSKLQFSNDGTTFEDIGSGGGGDFDPTLGTENPVLFDEFLAERDGLMIGDLGWAALLSSGSNVLDRAVTSGETNRAGVIQITHGTGSGAISSISISEQSMYLGASTVTLAAAVKILAIPDGTDNTRIGVGLMNTQNIASVTDGAYLHVSDSVNTTNWLCTTESGGTATETDTGVAFSTDWVNLRVEINAAASEVKCYINGTLVGTNTTNLPTATDVGPIITIRNDLGTASNGIDVDWFYMKQVFSAARGTF